VISLWEENPGNEDCKIKGKSVERGLKNVGIPRKSWDYFAPNESGSGKMSICSIYNHTETQLLRYWHTKRPNVNRVTLEHKFPYTSRKAASLFERSRWDLLPVFIVPSFSGVFPAKSNVRKRRDRNEFVLPGNGVNAAQFVSEETESGA